MDKAAVSSNPQSRDREAGHGPKGAHRAQVALLGAGVTAGAEQVPGATGKPQRGGSQRSSQPPANRPDSHEGTDSGVTGAQ